MDVTAADSAAMAIAAQQIEAKHQQIHQLQERLEGQMANLSTRWQGNASAAFQHGYSRFDTEFERVKQGLDRIHSSLVETSREHTHRQAVNGTTVTRLPRANGSRR